MEKKNFIIAILAVALASASLLYGVIYRHPTQVPTAADLKAEIERVKAGLPPTWGGWPAYGYMIKVKGGPTIYFTADTDLMLNWDAVREYYKPDIVIATNSVLYQNGINEWVYAVNKIKPKYVMASHHGSFPFYPKTDAEFAQTITEKTSATGVHLPAPGTEFELMGVKFTWLGHASFLIETAGGSRIVLDPEWNAVNIEDFPEALKSSESMAADLILVSHGHYDHFDPKALQVLMAPSKNRNPHLGMLFEFGAYAQKLMPELASRIVLFNMGAWIDKNLLNNAYGVTMTHLDDVEFAAIFATHSSGVFSPIK